jgi:tetratricopeptide (TPR) repeat protein
MIRTRVKDEYPELSNDFVKLAEFDKNYKKRFYKYIYFNYSKGIDNFESHLGYIATLYLMYSLQKSRDLFKGFIDCINLKNFNLLFLSTRAHLEITASIAYFLRYLISYYDSKIKYEEIINLLSKLFEGTRKYPTSYEAINVLTMLDGADKLFREMKKRANYNVVKLYKILGTEIFRGVYELLSEYCHPNFPGFIYSVETNEKNKFIFSDKLIIDENCLGMVLKSIEISLLSFFSVYDDCFSLLNKNEKMPKMFKHIHLKGY